MMYDSRCSGMGLHAGQAVLQSEIYASGRRIRVQDRHREDIGILVRLGCPYLRFLNKYITLAPHMEGRAVQQRQARPRVALGYIIIVFVGFPELVKQSGSVPGQIKCTALSVPLMNCSNFNT